MQSCIQTKQVNAFYALSRSLAIALLDFIKILITNNSFLISLSILMIIVQLSDGIVGIISKNRFKTYGPFIVSLVHSCLLIIFIVF